MKLTLLLLVSAVLLVATSTLETAKAKYVADNFHGIDFKNYTYPYRFSWGRNVRVALKDGKYEYDLKMERGWFSLAHVYVADVTGDNRPEAIVMLWHVACGGSCDGGSALFYIYSFQNRTLKLLWQYETGSLAYGCGLKSFAAKGKTLTVELFGRCSRRNQTTSVMGKFQVKDATRVTFQSNRARFVVRKRKFLSVPEQSVLNYEPQIKICERTQESESHRFHLSTNLSKHRSKWRTGQSPASLQTRPLSPTTRRRRRADRFPPAAAPRLPIALSNSHR